MAYVYIPRPILHGSGRKGRRRFPLQENGRPAYISSGSPISGAGFRRVSFFSSLAAYCSRMARKRWQSEPTMPYQPLSSRSNARARADAEGSAGVFHVNEVNDPGYQRAEASEIGGDLAHSGLGALVKKDDQGSDEPEAENAHAAH